MKNITFIIFLCFANVFCFAGNTNDLLKSPDSLDIIVSSIAHAEVFEESATIGFAGRPSQQAIRLTHLIQLASTSELSALTKNKSAIVRLYSFIALLAKNVPIPADMRTRMLNDKAVIVSINGCNAKEKTVSSIIKEKMPQADKSKI